MLNYKEILRVISVHKEKYDPDGIVRGNGGYKYLKIIQPSIIKPPPSLADELAQGATGKGLLHMA